MVREITLALYRQQFTIFKSRLDRINIVPPPYHRLKKWQIKRRCNGEDTAH